jgi:deoxyadenosine/deoxycytidine kinase
LFFLFQRIQQIRTLSQADLFRRATVADFMLDKDPLFARLTLNDDELSLYQQIYAQMKPQAAVPDLVIYLQASTETLIERVKRRAINYERAISEDYLLRLAETYARFFYQYDAAPVLIVNSEHLNFVDTPADFELLLQRIAAMRGAREFFNLGE